MSRIVIALGGNALGDTPAEQRAAIDKAAPPLIGLIAQGYEIVVSHGNGPQVGAISAAFAAAHGAVPGVPLMDLPECTAMSQGYIGYHLQQGLLREVRRRGCRGTSHPSSPRWRSIRTIRRSRSRPNRSGRSTRRRRRRP